MVDRATTALVILLGVVETTLAQPLSAPQPWTIPGPSVGRPAPSSAPDPRLSAAQAAFENLPEAERKAIQDDLVWAGDYLGAVDGGFGRRTFEAVLAYEKRSGAAADGTLAPPERAALALAARRARSVAGFESTADPRSGVRLGVPGALLPKRSDAPAGGTRWQSADERVTLETRVAPPDGGDLPALFERLTGASVPGRRVTYKLLRPDILVVSGETASGRFYTRYAGGPGGIRGFSIGYDRALAPQFDRLAVAIANSFEAFPSNASPSLARGAPPASPVIPAPSSGSSPAVAATPSVVRPSAPPAERRGNAVAFADGRAVTTTAVVAGCRSLAVGGRTVGILATDTALGLALIAGGPPSGTGLRLASGALVGGEPLVVLGHGGGDAGRLAVSPGEAVARPGERPEVVAALQAGAAASPVLNRQGMLVGLVAGEPPTDRRLADLNPAMRHGLVPGSDVARFAASHNALPSGAGYEGASNADRTTGDLATSVGPLVLQVTCKV